MGRKPKFRPVITRVKLNPEQAVLTCNCYRLGWKIHNVGSDTGIDRFFSGVGHSCIGKEYGWDTYMRIGSTWSGAQTNTSS